MKARTREKIFLSYSHRDRSIYEEVKQKLLDRGLERHLWDDTEIRPSDQWDDRIREAMNEKAVAVLILSDQYFRRRAGGGDYILELELPYFLEHYEWGEIDLLALYWSPSPCFAPDRLERVKPFEYRWQGRAKSYDLHRIQVLSRSERLALAGDQTRLDVLQDLALEGERRLNERLAS
jgi:hypothetical protein